LGDDRRRRAGARHRARSVSAQHVPRRRPDLFDQALAVAARAIGRGVDARIAPDLIEFLYMPFMHSERLADQDRCVALFRSRGRPENLKFAEVHADIIRKFGRFPHRNALLGRMTSAEEQAFLDAGGFAG
jgi:uncharacterized protein (DUF924 family)